VVSIREVALYRQIKIDGKLYGLKRRLTTRNLSYQRKCFHGA